MTHQKRCWPPSVATSIWPKPCCSPTCPAASTAICKPGLRITDPCPRTAIDSQRPPPAATCDHPRNA
jgi:hypothetical protein